MEFDRGCVGGFHEARWGIHVTRPNVGTSVQVRAHTRCEGSSRILRRIVVLCAKHYRTTWHLHLPFEHKYEDSLLFIGYSALTRMTIVCAYSSTAGTGLSLPMLERHTSITPGIIVWGYDFWSPLVVTRRTLRSYPSWDSTLVQAFNKTMPVHRARVSIDCLCYAELLRVSWSFSNQTCVGSAQDQLPCVGSPHSCEPSPGSGVPHLLMKQS